MVTEGKESSRLAVTQVLAGASPVGHPKYFINMTSVEAITELRQIVDEILLVASKKCHRGDKWIRYTLNG